MSIAETDLPPPPADRPAPDPSATQERIEDALLGLLADGERLNHDSVAERAGISRRTVYRYFPDREALLGAVTARIRRLAGPQVSFPADEEALLATLQPIYEGFDRVAPLATLLRSTPQGRAVRLAEKARRAESYAAATAGAVSGLPAHDAKLATAMLQVLHTTPWLEMRDQWDLSGSEIAEACRWAMLTLLADLRKRGGRPLSEGPAG